MLFCMFSLFNVSSIFPGGGQLTPFALMCERPCLVAVYVCVSLEGITLLSIART